MADRQRVIFAGHCYPCDACGEPVCPACGIHYVDCDCPGPHSEGWNIFKEDGVLWAEKENPAG